MSKKGDISQLKVAIVHDQLTRRGGAEVVLEEIVHILPQAHIFTLFAGNNPIMKVNNQSYRLNTSYLQKFPLWFRRRQARLLPFLSHAAEQFDLSNYDLVISSSSGFAKAVITRVNIPHICYCHTPTRYLWDATHEVSADNSGLTRTPAKLIFHYLRLADYAAAQRVDYFLANSRYTQLRIQSYYRRPSEIIYPPIATEFYTPASNASKPPLGLKPHGYFLCVGRLNKSKHFDQAARVCAKLRLPLVIVGQGPERNHLSQLGTPGARIIDGASPQSLRDLYRSARALIQSSAEDFGMAMAESLACGVPVIALGQGGSREIVINHETGILYNTGQDEFLAEAIRQFMRIEKKLTHERLQQSVLNFNRARFKTDFIAFIAKVMDDRERQQIKS